MSPKAQSSLDASHVKVKSRETQFQDVAPKVLVVDDDLMNIDVFEAVLLELGQTCETAMGGD